VPLDDLGLRRAGGGRRDRQLEDTIFWRELMADVFGSREGGAIIVIDAENARKGVAKTSAAVATADKLAEKFGYELESADGVMSARGVIERYRAHPGQGQPSVLVWDEAVGGGDGDARRAMSTSNVKLGRAWQILRTKRIITLTTLPNWGDLDPRLRKLADYRLWCRERPIGRFQPFKIGTSFDGDEVQTYGLGADGADEIRFPDATADYPHRGDDSTGTHPLYASLKERKAELMDTSDFEAGQLDDDDGEGIDEEAREAVAKQVKRDAAIQTVIKAVKPWDDSRGMSYPEAATLVDYSRGWVGNRVREWREQQMHRDLVSEPANRSDNHNNKSQMHG
jgi:hypothetical protein